jgi:dienelactone hydrolase
VWTRCSPFFLDRLLVGGLCGLPHSETPGSHLLPTDALGEALLMDTPGPSFVPSSRVTRIFRVATAIVALHIVDVELVQTRPGTSARDHVLALVVPLAVAALAAATFGRLRPGIRAGIALAFGSLALVAAGIAAAGGISGSDVSGLLLFPAGVALIAISVWLPWRERGRWASTRTRRMINRVAAGALGVAAALFVVMPIGTALWTTQKPPGAIGKFGIPHRDVAFAAVDGIQLSGWYVRSRNGAAVVIVHGGGGNRGGARRHATMLARAGYGVLLYDARGRGRSDGDTDAYGWTWRPDVEAAMDWVERQRDVRGGRVGALGLSTGADVLVEEASRRRDIKAIVADGTTAESLSDSRRIVHGGNAVSSLPFFAVQYAAAAVLEDARPSAPLVDAASHAAPTPILFIASSWQVERAAAPIYARAAGASSSLWRVAAGHTGGLRAHPREYARRVVAFFDRHLLENIDNERHPAKGSR